MGDVGTSVRRFVDRFDGSTNWQTSLVTIGEVDGAWYAQLNFAQAVEGTRQPIEVLTIFARIATDWAWLEGHQTIALADGARLLPHSTRIDTEVMEDGLVQERVTAWWSMPDFRQLAAARLPEVRIGGIELVVSGCLGSWRALLESIDGV